MLQPHSDGILPVAACCAYIIAYRAQQMCNKLRKNLVNWHQQIQQSFNAIFVIVLNSEPKSPVFVELSQ